MTLMACRHCAAEVHNGLALCQTCQAGTRLYLEVLPTYFRNLARWRPGRAGSRQVHGSRVLYDGAETTGSGDRIGDRLDEAHTALLTWGRVLVEDRPIGQGPRPLGEADAVLTDMTDRGAGLPEDYRDRLDEDPAATVRVLCAGFAHHLTSIATTSWCGEFVRELAQHEEVLRRLTETAVPGWYAGTCRAALNRTMASTVAGVCGAPTYAVPGLSWVTCRACGDTTHVGAHLDAILEEAADWVAPPRALAVAVVALVDAEPSVTSVYARIRKWAERELIEPVHRTARDYAYDADLDGMVVVDSATGQARYRLGDVVRLVRERPARRSRAKRPEPVG